MGVAIPPRHDVRLAVVVVNVAEREANRNFFCFPLWISFIYLFPVLFYYCQLALVRNL